MDTTNNTGEWYDACDSYTAVPARKKSTKFRMVRVSPTILYVFGTTQDEWVLTA